MERKYQALCRFVARKGQLILSRIDARNGAIGVVPQSLDGGVVTNDFPLFKVNEDKAVGSYINWLSQTADFVELCKRASEGTTNRVRLQEERFLSLEVPLPQLHEQQRIVARIEELAAKVNEARKLRQHSIGEGEAVAGAVANRLLARFSDRHAIEAFTDVRGEIQKGPHRAPGANPVRYLTVAHVQRNHILTNDPRYFEVTPTELERWRLWPGDF